MGKTARLIIPRCLMLFAWATAALPVQADDADSIPKLPTVHVRARGAGVHVRNDTVEYNAAAYKGPDVRKVQDLLARLEGFSVTPDGRVHFNGQEIETILLNGEDMTGTNYRLLSTYLRAGLVKKVQVLRDYDPDPLMREMRRSGKIGLSLVLHDSLTRSLSGGLDIGATARGRKDMDLHLIRLQGPRKSITLGKWNGTGETVTGNRDFYAREGAQDIAPEEGTGLRSPAHVGGIFPPSLPDAYVRDNEDLSLSFIRKRSIGAGKQLGLIAGADRTALDREQAKTSRWALPDGTDWMMAERENVHARALIGFLRAEYTEERGRRGRGSIRLEGHGLGASSLHQDAVRGAFTDHLVEQDRGQAIRFSLRANNSWRMRSGAWQAEVRLTNGRERQLFRAEGEALVNIGVDSGVQKLDQTWVLRSWQQEVRLKYLRVARKRPIVVGLHYLGSEGTRAVRWDKKDDRATVLAFCDQALTIEGEKEWKVGRNSRLSTRADLGVGAWRSRHDGAFRSAVLHDVALGFQHRSGPFKAWALGYRDVRAFPGDEYVLPMAMASGGYTIIAPLQERVPASTHQLSFDLTARNVAAGAGMMLLLRGAVHENEMLPAVRMKPGVTLIMPMQAGRSRDLQATVGGDVHLSPVRMKLGGDLHVTARWGRASVNRVWSDRSMGNSGFALRMVSTWKAAVNVDAVFNLDHNRYVDRSALGDRSFSVWSHALRVKCRARWNERWYAALAVERLSVPGLPSFVAADLHLSWQCHERLSFSLKAHNLLDRKRSVTRWAGAGSEGETVYRVVPGYILWKLSWALG